MDVGTHPNSEPTFSCWVLMVKITTEMQPLAWEKLQIVYASSSITGCPQSVYTLKQLIAQLMFLSVQIQPIGIINGIQSVCTFFGGTPCIRLLLSKHQKNLFPKDRDGTCYAGLWDAPCSVLKHLRAGCKIIHFSWCWHPGCTQEDIQAVNEDLLPQATSP